MNGRTKIPEDDNAGNFAELLKNTKINREIDFSKINNRIQLKRILNSTAQIEGYVENLLDVSQSYERLVKRFSEKKISEEKFYEGRAEICEDTLKNLFEIVALLFNIAENQEPEKRGSLLPLIETITKRTDLLKNDFDGIFEKVHNEELRTKLENIYFTITGQLEGIKNLIAE